MRKLWKNCAALAITLVCALLVVAYKAPISAQAASLPKAPDCEITYDFGNGQLYQIKSGLAMTMMMTNPDGSYYIDPATNYYVLDEAKMNAFFASLSLLYPHESDELDFLSTRGDVIHITEGNQKQRFLDSRTEIPYLANAIMSGAKETHTPTWSVGGTYIEVDMTTQMLYYYVNNELVIKSPVVTGNTGIGHGTPTGCYFVNSKLRDTNLVGVDYVSYVNYWIAVIGNSIGIHDATWRGTFGGSIYTYNGSHGCVNVPLTVMKDLYPMVEKGTIVLLFY